MVIDRSGRSDTVHIETVAVLEPCKSKSPGEL